MADWRRQLSSDRRKSAMAKVLTARQPAAACPPRSASGRDRLDKVAVPAVSTLVSQQASALQVLPSKRRARPSTDRVVKRPAAALQPGTRALSGQVTACEAATVGSKDALRKYEAIFERTKCWAAKFGRSLTLPLVEETLLDFLDVLLADRARLDQAENAVSAAVHFIPGLTRPEMKRVKKALKGFRKLRPSHSRVPLPEEIAMGMAAAAFMMGMVELGRKILVMFCLKTRPGEASKLLGEDLNPPAGGPGSGLEFWSITIAPSARLEASKTQTWDDCVIARDPFMSSVLAALKSNAASPKAPVFPSEPKIMQQQWKYLRQILQEPKAVMYQLRHGGASEALLKDPKSGLQVQAELRHKTATSMRRYGKPGQIQQVLAAKHVLVREFCQTAVQNMDQIVENRFPKLLRSRFANLRALVGL